MERTRRQQARTYLIPGTGWVGHDDPSATLRLSARVSARVHTTVENILEERVGDGWQRVGDEATRSAIERGLVWYGYEGSRRGRRLAFLRGVRAIDETLASTLLDGLVVLDHDGQELEETGLAGLRFALAADALPTFLARVRAAGGALIKDAPSGGEIAQHHATLVSCADALVEAAEWADRLITQGSRGVTIELPEISARSEGVWKAHARALRAEAGIESAQQRRHDDGYSVPELVHSQQMADEAAVLVARCQEAFARYRASEVVAVRLLARLDAADEHFDALGERSVDRIDALALLAAGMRAEGQDARLSDGELVVGLERGEVVITPSRVRLRRRAQDG